MVSAYRFLNDQRGAVTIDFVAMGAAALVVGIATLWAVYNNGVEPTVGEVNSVLANFTDEIKAPPPPTFGN